MKRILREFEPLARGQLRYSVGVLTGQQPFMKGRPVETISRQARVVSLKHLIIHGMGILTRA
jgi:hypothetical protein